MNNATNAVFHCSHCKKVIVSGERMCSVNVHWETCSDGCITVHEATNYLVFCSACARQRNFYGMTIPLIDEQDST